MAHNRFDTNNRSGDAGGSGVFVCCGPGNDLTVSDNLFTGHSSAAVNTAGDASRPSTGLRVERNQSIDDATFAVVVNATGASVADNVVLRSQRPAPAAGSALYVGGGTSGVQVVRNTIIGGAATGVRVTNLFGTPNQGLVVSGNRIVSRSDGIRLTGQRSGSISTNVIATSTDVGILLDADNAGVTVTGNRIAASKVLDCRDDSRGGGTAGTADTWRGNQALRSAPAGICGH